MNPNTLRALVVLGLCMAAAVLLGTVLGTGNFEFLFLFAYALLGIYMIAAPGLVPLLAIGLICPFTLPIPFIHAFPFVLLILGVCCLKLFLWRAMAGKDTEKYRHCFTIGFLVFFAWVAMRFCMSPVMPNVRGFGANVSGFRAYLDYGASFILVALLPFIVTNREEALRLMRWLGGLSIFFILFLTPFMFTKSVTVAAWLARFGIPVMTFDNGWLRFVALPTLGLILILLAMLPDLNFFRKQRFRALLAGLGIMAIILGGNRSSLAMGFAMVCVVLFLRRKVLALGLMIIGIGLALVSFHIIGERIDLNQPMALLRLLSVSSSRVAQASGATDTFEWRVVRWERAMEHIRRNPYFGTGYGGLQNAWVFRDENEFSEAMVDVAVAAGSIHNGYLASACALGIPGTILFLITFLTQIAVNGRRALRLEETDPQLSALQIFVCAQLVGLALSISIGADLNHFTIWFYLGLGVVAQRLTQRENLVEPISRQPVAPTLPMGRRSPNFGTAALARGH